MHSIQVVNLDRLGRAELLEEAADVGIAEEIRFGEREAPDGYGEPVTMITAVVSATAAAVSTLIAWLDRRKRNGQIDEQLVVSAADGGEVHIHVHLEVKPGVDGRDAIAALLRDHPSLPDSVRKLVSPPAGG